MSGSGADIGYEYQADAVAYIAAHGLSGQPLAWFEEPADIPVRWLAETGGPGDDIRVLTEEGRAIELQSKHGLQRGEEYYSALHKLAMGLEKDTSLRAVLLVDRDASRIIREDLKRDVLRLGQGRSDGVARVTDELLVELKSRGLTDMSIFARLRVVVVDLDEGSDGLAAAQALLARVVAAKEALTAFRLLGKRAHGLIKNRGQDDVVRCAKFLDAEVGLTSAVESPATSLTRFTQWILSNNETFYSPAIRQRFPIREAWSHVVPSILGLKEKC